MLIPDSPDFLDFFDVVASDCEPEPPPAPELMPVSAPPPDCPDEVPDAAYVDATRPALRANPIIAVITLELINPP
jgi:hypothetical protein